MKRSDFLPYAIVLIILALAVFLLSKTSIFRSVEGLVSAVSSPLRISLLSVFKDSEGDWDKQIIELSEKLVDGKKLELEVKALRDQFETTNPKTSQLLPGKIVGIRDESLIINAGERDGVKAGQAAVLGGNLVGTVSDISENFAKIELLTSKKTSFAARTEDGALGIIKGRDTELLRFENVPVSEKVEKDSLIFTRGDQSIEGLGIPSDLIVGKVINVEKKPEELFQNISAKSLVNFSRLDRVFLVIE